MNNHIDITKFPQEVQALIEAAKKNPKKKILLINASILKESDCSYKFHLIHDRGLLHRGETFKMDYGTAGHKALACRFRGMDEPSCIATALETYIKTCAQVPEDDFRTSFHLACTLKHYFKHFPLGRDCLIPDRIGNDLFIEVPFAWPYSSESDLDIILCGTIDFRGHYAGYHSIIDHKFTSMVDQDKYMKSYELSLQLEFYSYMNKLIFGGNDWIPCVINAIFIKRQTKKAEKMGIFDGCEVRRSDLIEFNDERMAKFELWLKDRIELIKANFRAGRWLENHTRCQKIYGLCEFFNICRLRDKYRDEYISREYDVRVYNPLVFQVD